MRAATPDATPLAGLMTIGCTFGVRTRSPAASCGGLFYKDFRARLDPQAVQYSRPLFDPCFGLSAKVRGCRISRKFSVLLQLPVIQAGGREAGLCGRLGVEPCEKVLNIHPPQAGIGLLVGLQNGVANVIRLASGVTSGRIVIFE
jgi:hypothetical protein